MALSFCKLNGEFDARNVSLLHLRNGRTHLFGTCGHRRPGELGIVGGELGIVGGELGIVGDRMG